MPEKVKIIAVTGPTATGKTALAVKLARRFGGEIVSVDSRQVYRHMDLGTGKDLEEYGEVPFHLIDVADPATQVWNLSDFCRGAFAAVAGIRERGRLPILCGGTALYLDALLEGYRLPGGALPPREKGAPRSSADREGAPSFTPPFELDALVIGVLFDRAVVRDRIEKRLDARRRLRYAQLDGRGQRERRDRHRRSRKQSRHDGWDDQRNLWRDDDDGRGAHGRPAPRGDAPAVRP